jgi:hypothetical protein
MNNGHKRKADPDVVAEINGEQGTRKKIKVSVVPAVDLYEWTSTTFFRAALFFLLPLLGVLSDWTAVPWLSTVVLGSPVLAPRPVGDNMDWFIILAMTRNRAGAIYWSLKST